MENEEKIVAELNAFRRCISWYCMLHTGLLGNMFFPNYYKIKLTEKDLIVEQTVGPKKKRSTDTIALDQIQSVSTPKLCTSDYFDVLLKDGSVLKFKAVVFKKDQKESYNIFRNNFDSLK